MSAAAIGCSVEGERLKASRTRVRLPHGTVRLDCDWPAGPTALRGAIVEQLGRERAHVDLHGHIDDERTRRSPATVCYRIRERQPEIWAYGPRAIHHLAEIGALGQLCLPNGGVRTVTGAAVSHDATEVGVHKERWFRYELVTPFYPPTVTGRRRPRSSRDRVAWAGQALHKAIWMWLEHVGVSLDPAGRPLHVHVEDGASRRVRWRSGSEEWGFSARFVTNAILLPGLGLGQHISEGFGEVRPC